VQFYRGSGTDHRGRRLDDILAWDDGKLEEVHDFIQWLFPLEEPSAVNPRAPILVDADRRAFADEPALGANLRRSFARMLSFYGLQLVEGAGAPRVLRSGKWPERSPNWLTPHNHNHLRLTRIIKSLALLGMGDLGRALFDALAEEYGRGVSAVIGPTTFEFWRSAAAGP
jgi:hypothetical protein